MSLKCSWVGLWLMNLESGRSGIRMMDLEDSEFGGNCGIGLSDWSAPGYVDRCTGIRKAIGGNIDID